jgi:hypothetical protein
MACFYHKKSIWKKNEKITYLSTSQPNIFTYDKLFRTKVCRNVVLESFMQKYTHLTKTSL